MFLMYRYHFHAKLDSFQTRPTILTISLVLRSYMLICVFLNYCLVEDCFLTFTSADIIGCKFDTFSIKLNSFQIKLDTLLS